jgi:hypothetical protein
MAILNFTGISFPKNFSSRVLAREIESIMAKRHLSDPGQAVILTISDFSAPIGVPLASRSLARDSRDVGET